MIFKEIFYDGIMLRDLRLYSLIGGLVAVAMCGSDQRISLFPCTLEISHGFN